MEKIREISDNELLYCDLQDITSTSFTIQYLIEYENNIDKNSIELAILNMKKENPQAFVSKKGNTWIKANVFSNVEEINIDDSEIINNELFFEKLNYNQETVRFYIIKNKLKNYFLIRFSHSVFDGKGALNFIEKLFSYINEVSYDNLDNSITDSEYIKDLDIKNKVLDFSNNYHLSNYNKNQDRITKYKVINMPKYHQGIIAKIAKILAKYFKEDYVCFMIPTDIRRHKAKRKYLSNLTLPIFLDVSMKEKWEDINGKLLYELKNKNELNIKATKHFNRYFTPSFIRKIFLKMMINSKAKENSFLIGAIISHLGRIDIKTLNIRKNKALSFISLPVQQPLAPFSFVITEFENRTNIAFAYYDEYTSIQLINSFMQDLKTNLITPIDYSFNTQTKTDIENFVDIIFKQVKNNLEKIAIWDDSEYTYSELLTRSSQIAEELKQKRVNNGDKVIIYANRSFDYVASILAILKIGACFVPVDKNENVEKLKQIIEATQAQIILSHFDINITDIEIVNFNSINSNSACEEQFYNYQKSDEIYNIFTSGTTGVPKGVSISAENFSNYINWAKETYTSQNRIIMPLFTSLSVDLTMTSVFLPLITGGGIKIFKEEFNNLILDDIFKDENINYVKCTPGHLSILPSDTIYKSKEWLIIGGENFKNKLYEKIKKTSLNIVNEYGPTETTVGSIYQIVNENNKHQNIPIGLPISNTNIFLVDDNNQLIENESEIGEIVISGIGVSKGYINTSSNSFKNFNNEICYYTGDYGYYEDGKFHCIGRKDSQIKINGQRIELEEITSKLLEINGVADAYSLFYKNRIISFIVLTDAIIQKENIFKELKLKLQNNAIPSIIEFIEQLPLLNNGKIDKNSLIKLIKFNQETFIPAEIKEHPIKQLIKDTFTDNMLDLLVDDLHNIGLNSLDILVLGQKLADKYITSSNQEEFLKKYISEIPKLNIPKLEELIQQYGGVL